MVEDLLKNTQQLEPAAIPQRLLYCSNPSSIKFCLISGWTESWYNSAKQIW